MGALGNLIDKTTIANEVARILKSNGYNSYIMGATVRSLLHAAKVQSSSDGNDDDNDDIEMVTNAPAKELLRIDPDYDVLPESAMQDSTGGSTVRILVNGATVQLASFRPGAKTLKDELAGRDFTINAIALDGLTGVIHDPFGGMEDLSSNRKLVRAVGGASECMAKDPVRAIRAARLACQLNFGIQYETSEAMRSEHVETEIAKMTAGGISRKSNATTTTTIQCKRIGREFMMGLATERAEQFIAMLAGSNLLFAILPEMRRTVGQIQHPARHRFDVYNHSIRTMVALGKGAEPLLKLAALLHDIGKPATFTSDCDGNALFSGHAKVGAHIVEGIMHRFGMGTYEIEIVSRLVRNHSINYDPTWTKIDIMQWLAKVGYRNWPDQLRLAMADAKATGMPADSQIRALGELWLRADRMMRTDIAPGLFNAMAQQSAGAIDEFISSLIAAKMYAVPSKRDDDNNNKSSGSAFDIN